MAVDSANTLDVEAIQTVKDSVADAIRNKPHLQMYCSDDCILRFLRARHMDPQKASRMLTETLHWREESKIHKVRFQDVAAQASTGKIMIAKCRTHEGRPVLVLRPGHENNTKDQDENIKHFAYQIESVTRVADRLPGDGKIMTIVDYDGWTLKKSPPMKTSMATLKILQHHYPERLHLCICWHPPSVFNAFWKLLSPFIDPVTAKKVSLLPRGDKTALGKLAEQCAFHPFLHASLRVLRSHVNEVLAVSNVSHMLSHQTLAGSHEPVMCSLDTSQLDAGLGGSVPDVYNLVEWTKMLSESDQMYQAELDKFIASQDAARLQAAE